jgi:exopolyphosphatase/guanosine-5'-triphosphate,3'-diphosphate pyrophosphatase
MPNRDETINIAAIDAGSNAIRLVIARTNSPQAYQELKNERAALRLGHHAFTQRRFDGQTIDQAVEVFRRFKSRMNQHNVQRYRAVATSAARDARNRKVLVDRIFRASGIRLEVIDGPEEARLVRSAVLAAVRKSFSPRVVADLGGGSLQINFLKEGSLENAASLSLGTVRLMEKYGIQGAMTEQQVGLIRERTLTVFRRFLPPGCRASAWPTVWCGGNAEALSLIAPGAPVHGIPTIDLGALQRKLRRITGMDVAQRMEAFLIRKDRAEVIAIAAIVLVALGRCLHLPRAVVPGVGVKEGVLEDVLRSLYGRDDEAGLQQPEVVPFARRFAVRLGYDARHCEHVCDLAASLFDQLRAVHGMGDRSRSLLQVSALLHDIGHSIHRESHHKIGEFLVRNADIPGLSGADRDVVSCVVRYHSESGPNADHKVYASLAPEKRREVRGLVALLRIADRLDSDHRQSVSRVLARITPRGVSLELKMQRASDLILWSVEGGIGLFEEEFGVKVAVARVS